jgi:hypothetical protein
VPTRHLRDRTGPPRTPGRTRLRTGPLSRELGTYTAVKARFWPWRPGESPYNLLRCSHFARKRPGAGPAAPALRVRHAGPGRTSRPRARMPAPAPIAFNILVYCFQYTIHLRAIYCAITIHYCSSTSRPRVRMPAPAPVAIIYYHLLSFAVRILFITIQLPSITVQSLSITIQLQGYLAHTKHPPPLGPP